MPDGQSISGTERDETRCHICGRAMVTGTHLPLDICRRAGCEPEREHLNREHVRILDHFDWIAQTARAAGSGVNRA